MHKRYKCAVDCQSMLAVHLCARKIVLAGRVEAEDAAAIAVGAHIVVHDPQRVARHARLGDELAAGEPEPFGRRADAGHRHHFGDILEQFQPDGERPYGEQLPEFPRHARKRRRGDIVTVLVRHGEIPFIDRGAAALEARPGSRDPMRMRHITGAGRTVETVSAGGVARPGGATVPRILANTPRRPAVAFAVTVPNVRPRPLRR